MSGLTQSVEYLYYSVQVPKFCRSTVLISGPGSVVSIATVYGLDGPGIESR